MRTAATSGIRSESEVGERLQIFGANSSVINEIVMKDTHAKKKAPNKMYQDKIRLQGEGDATILVEDII